MRAENIAGYTQKQRMQHPEGVAEMPLCAGSDSGMDTRMTGANRSPLYI